MIASLKDHQGLWRLDKASSDSSEPMPKAASVNLIKRKMLAALSIDWELKVEENGDKTKATEKTYTTFVNKEVVLDPGKDGEYKSFISYFDDAFAVDCEKEIKYDPKTGIIHTHARSTGKYKGIQWHETREINADGNLIWVASMKYKGTTTRNVRTFKRPKHYNARWH
ncbi:hypothetical protein SARC_11077 [Sphaeroforma arctica JP610]|uniref:Uncharacterized protein n=1 Tax=Sphaeroforma arctica JP610 TaxID=667725 RepID=A0A0L0FI02_9EUKA|nr:hypothetical protein SARC_11077 [Sphaeroforma arctica JP610]KNC76422.1 hypothetical protein SARC_11077 [Sphaeroforma arctica JP610]|eukprot:XP_014150324.1 hypothetical protein SARC_11077 [Sphaeroforma arctica JP610]